MADEFQHGSGSWWDTSRSRFDGETTSASIPTTLSAIAAASFGWPTEVVDMKPPRSSMDSGASMLLHGGPDQPSPGGSGGVLADHNSLQMMGLGLPSQGLDWNPVLLGEKGESSFRSMLQEDNLSSSNTSNFLHHESSPQQHWTQKLYSGSSASPEDSSVHDFRQVNRGFSLDQAASSNESTITSGHNLATSFPLDSTYGLWLPENQSQHADMNFPYPSPDAAGLIPTWNKFPQRFLRTSPPPPPQPSGSGTQLHFTNNTPFWNASARTTSVTDHTRSSVYPDIQTQISARPSFDDKTKNSSEARDLSTSSSTMKKSSTETSNKRSRNETPSPLPAAFKVRKEKMGDRITALQQLVSPFGKTDTASVLSEAIEYIKFLHEQVSICVNNHGQVLSTPYLKNGTPIRHQPQNPADKSNKDPAVEGPRHDLRSQGLCLVPVSSTFPMTHETTVDFWTPTFGASFR